MLTKWYVSSFWDHCWSCVHALGSTLHILWWPSFALFLKSEKYGVCVTLGKVFPLGRISCCPCVTKRWGISVLGLRTARTAWLWGCCTNLVTLGLSYGALLTRAEADGFIGREGQWLIQQPSCFRLSECNKLKDFTKTKPWRAMSTCLQLDL